MHGPRHRATPHQHQYLRPTPVPPPNTSTPAQRQPAAPLPARPNPAPGFPIPIWGLCSAPGSLEDGSVLLAAAAAPLYMVGPALRLLAFRHAPTSLCEIPWRVSAEQGQANRRATHQGIVTRTKYKTVDRKVRPVPSYMPDESNQMFQPVTIPQLPPLSLNPPLLENFVPTERLTRERLDVILASVPEGFLQPREIDLLVDVLRTRELGLAFVDSERGTFSDEFYPDYEIPVIEHTPWVQDPIRIPKSIEDTVVEELIAALRESMSGRLTTDRRVDL
ncbi:hypothetical protein Hypma_004878 [Hypsizygus marmoreus]|uniref:Uncharacterized protein n=1 Tax=Hypsizygus marmoreus TaxID=39966 RepID=A0A369KE50_HYPMA|nr:hypothetical protein Hypma_004878 [Hypsizygus marmoreus]